MILHSRLVNFIFFLNLTFIGFRQKCEIRVAVNKLMSTYTICQDRRCERVSDRASSIWDRRNRKKYTQMAEITRIL